MSEMISQVSDIIQVPVLSAVEGPALSAVEVIEVQRTTELPPLRVMFQGRDHPTAEDVVEYYRQLTGRRVTRLYHYITPTLHHVSWHIDVSNDTGARNGNEANIQDN